MGLFDERTGGLVTYWKSVSAITSLVGTTTAARIYPDMAKQGAALPYIIYTRNGGEVFIHLRGSTGARTSVVHVYCCASTRAGADALAEAVKQNTQNKRDTWSGTNILWVFCTDAPDDGYDAPQDKGHQARYWTRLVFRIVHSEAGGT